MYTPFVFGPAVVEEGISKYWMAHLQEFAQSTRPLKELFPEGALLYMAILRSLLHQGSLLLFISQPSLRTKEGLSDFDPATLTAVLAGITEPLEFTFLFISPPLFCGARCFSSDHGGNDVCLQGRWRYGGGLIDLLAKV